MSTSEAETLRHVGKISTEAQFLMNSRIQVHFRQDLRDWQDVFGTKGAVGNFTHFCSKPVCIKVRVRTQDLTAN